MENTLLKKMIRNCFCQYNHNFDSIPLSSIEFDILCAKVLKAKEDNTCLEIHDIIQDVVYEYLTEV